MKVLFKTFNMCVFVCVRVSVCVFICVWERHGRPEREVLYASALVCVKKIVVKATPNKQQLFPGPFGSVQVLLLKFEIYNTFQNLMSVFRMVQPTIFLNYLPRQPMQKCDSNKSAKVEKQL